MRLWSSFFVAAMLAAAQASAEPKAIGFSDLVDPLAAAYDDPYRDMGPLLLNELKLLVELDQKLMQKDLGEDERNRITVRRSAAKDVLETSGQDVDALLAQRWDVARKRQAARVAPNPALDNVEVALSGYLIPAPKADDGAYVGYLVPQVGMCSHLPPPPPNQLVRVRLLDDPKVQSLYVPVQVSGRLSVEESYSSIHVLDGEVRMFSGWTLDASSVARREGPGGNGVGDGSEETSSAGASHTHADGS